MKIEYNSEGQLQIVLEKKSEVRNIRLMLENLKGEYERTAKELEDARVFRRPDEFEMAKQILEEINKDIDQVCYELFKLMHFAKEAEYFYDGE